MSESNVYYTPDNVPHEFRAFENIPEELRALPQWVCWKLETVDGRLTKIPYTAAGRKADTTDPATWGTFDSCCEALRSQKFFGIGFVFAGGGDFTGIDFDKHRNPDTGELDPFAAAHVAQLNSYTEASQSGTGCHVIARATIPSDTGRNDRKIGVEMYSKARFFVMTGTHLDGTPRTVESRQQAVERMFREIFPDKPKPSTSPPPQPLPITDCDLITKASQSKQGPQFSALWRGDFAAAGYGSHSEADAALLAMLKFWTGGDKARSFSMFAQSGLNREKWAREDYRENTWALVCGGETYSPPAEVGLHKSGASESLPSADEAGDNSSPNEAPQPPPVKRLSELARRTTNDPNELLRDGYLCRGGGALWVAQTGIGKSVAEMQAAILWAIGKPFFDIIPTRPLKSLIIQAENDDGDLAEFRDGIIAGLRLSPDEIKLVHENVLVVREDSRTGLPLCLYTVEPLLAELHPDILWLDPANSYLGGDANSQEIVGGFLRNMLNPLLRKHGCAVIVVHHTTKPPKDKTEWTGGDFAYLGAGSAEFANWARAVMAIRSTKATGIFELVAGKRGSRIGWKDDAGATCYTRLIAHSGEPGLIYWREPEAGEVEQSEQTVKQKTVADLIAHVPLEKPILKNRLSEKAQVAGIGVHKVRSLLDEALEAGSLYIWKKKRAGTNPAQYVSRTPQTEATL